MMTARAEHRLYLRADNATSRLGQAAIAAGCVSNRRRKTIEDRLALRDTPEWTFTDEGQADALYAPYLDRQRREWESVQRDVRVGIPGGFAFGSVPGISTEMIERLESARPETLDQASRVAGITPAALTALYVAVTRRAA
jgi:tRNA uridine 5-carboxymethylaminomethyl modification enzyme